MIPQQWFVCDACDGDGEVGTGRMSHSVCSATIEMPWEEVACCDKCGGVGGWIGDAESMEDLDMPTKQPKYRIFLEAVPSKDWPLKAGYFGPISQHVSTNHYIYCRTSDKDAAWEYSADEAIRTVIEMWGKGYPARCEPPILPSASPVLAAICGAS